MTRKHTAFVFARGGSKGVPRKNVKLLAGRPLLAHAIEAALASGVVDRVVVSTDDREIAEVARRYGAVTPFLRPAELSRDDSPEWLAWRHALDAMEAEDGRPLEMFISVPATSPLRTADDVRRCVERLETTDADLTLAVTPARRNPYFNMVSIDPHGDARVMIAPTGSVFRRQDAPVAYDLTTVCYCARPAYIRSASGVLSGRVKTIEVPAERALDVDDEYDFFVAEALLARRLSRSAGAPADGVSAEAA